MRLKIWMLVFVAFVALGLTAFGMVVGGAPYVTLNTRLAEIALLAVGALIVVWQLKK